MTKFYLNQKEKTKEKLPGNSDKDLNFYNFDKPESEIINSITALQAKNDRLWMENVQQTKLIGQLKANIEVLKKVSNEFKLNKQFYLLIKYKNK